MVYAVMFAAVVVYGGTWVVRFGLTTEALTIAHIALDGETALSETDVWSRLEGLRGQNILVVDLGEWRQKVLESPWIEAAAIRRVLPDSVDVSVVERQPMGVGRVGSALYLIDQDGEVIEAYGPGHEQFDLPLIDGLANTASIDPSGPAVDATRAALAARLMASLQRWPDLAKRVSQIDVTDPRDAVVILDGDTALIRLGGDQFAERLQAYLDVAEALRSEVPQIDYVDLRFGERVYVKPQPARGAGRNIAGGE